MYVEFLAFSTCYLHMGKTMHGRRLLLVSVCMSICSHMGRTGTVTLVS